MVHHGAVSGSPTLRCLALSSLGLLASLALSACVDPPAGDDDGGDEADESTGGDATETGTGGSGSDGPGTETDGGSETGGGEALTYWKDTKAILDANCVSCHREGDIGPFALETWAEVEAIAPALTGAVADGTMPPWLPSGECNSFVDDRSLSDADRQALLSWIDAGYPEGDPADAPPDPEPPATFESDFVVSLPEPYMPQQSPDDYRCFVIPWPEELTEPTFVTGQVAIPDKREQVHHVVTFVSDPGDAGYFENLDAAEEGPGYTCFGGPGALDWTARWLGTWVPGIDAWRAPEGTGVEIAPGSALIVQVHYNTLAGMAEPDQTQLGFQITDTVERPGTFIPLLDIGWLYGFSSMPIPAGDPDVHHQVAVAREHGLFDVTLAPLGVGSSETVEIWRSALHMHYLGTHTSMHVAHGGGDQSCLLQIDDWDFNWQNDYLFEQPVDFGAGDELVMDCWWDNSAENQPIIDGEQLPPVDRDWGEGTLDEMCLGIIYVARK